MATRLHHRVTARAALVLALLALVALPAARAAADVTFNAEVEARKVGVDDQFQLTLTIEGRSFDLKGDPQLPEMRNLRVVGGPSVSTQMSFVNGAVSQGKVYTWALQAVAPGPASIGPIRAAFSDGVRATQPIALEVVAGSALQRQPRGRGRDPFGSMFDDPMIDQMFGRGRQRGQENVRLLVEAEPSRSTLFVGEPLVLTYFLYTQTSVSNLDFEQAPAFPGFWSKDLERPTDQAGEPVTRDGAQYRRFVVFRKLLFPTKPGTLTIPATTLKIALAGGFFGESMVRRSTKPVDIAVEAVPAPAGYSGAVGQFRAATTVDRDTLAIGDAATVRFRVEGKGNLEWVERAPELKVPGAKVYPPQVKNEFKASADGVSGAKTWEWVVVPETAGTLTVPALAFEYFDPAARRVAHSDAAALDLRVGTATAQAPAALPAAPASRAAAPGAGDAGSLRLRADLGAGRAALPAPGAGGVLFVAALALVAHGALLVAPRLVRRGAGGVGGGARGANARAALATLRHATRDGVTKETAAAEIERALADVFGEIDERTDGGDAFEHDVRELLRDVRFIRYAPQLGDYSEKIREVADRAAAAIRRRP